MKKISIVIPCYNEGDGLCILHDRMSRLARSHPDYSFEVILIDDGSKDNSWHIMQDLARVDENLKAIKLARNHGHQIALTAGLCHVTGDFILILDADLQDPPELLGEMLRIMKDQRADVVYGKRNKRPGETKFKLLTAYLFYRTLNLLADANIPSDTGDFRLMTRRALKVLLKMPEHHRFIRGMVSWIGFKQVALFYDRETRSWGATGYSLRKMVIFAINAITSFSIKPLRLATYAGLATSFICFIMSLYAIYEKLAGNAIQGWSSIMITMLFLGSIQLVSIGIIGEYLGRLFIESKNRPLFVVDQICGKEVESCEKHPCDS